MMARGRARTEKRGATMAEISGARTFDALPDGFMTMLRDSGYIREKYESQGHRDVTIEECVGDDDSLRVVTSRVVTVELPGFAKKVLKPTNTMRQVDEWRRAGDGSWNGTFTVEVRGAPVQMRGTMALAPAGHGQTLETVRITVDAKVPLIGGKLADWIANGEGRATLEKELDFNERWLKAHS
jgi:hypothetical protein